MTSQNGPGKAAQNKRRVEVLCLTYGEPPVTDWKNQYFYSLAILNRLTRRVAPIPRFITPLIAARRGLIRKKTFEKISYTSPLEDVTHRQVEGLRRLLAEKDPSTHYDVRMVCEFRAPWIWDFLDSMKSDPPDDLIILPLYVAEGDFTSGISRTDLYNWHVKQAGANPLPRPKYLRGFGFDSDLGRLLADYVWNYCLEHGWDESKTSDAALILGSHGTLQIPPPGINGSGRETRYLFGLIRGHLKPRFHSMRLGWLNHTLGGKWTFPEVGEAAEEEWNAGRRKVVYFPFGFMADNAESQIEGKDALAEYEWEDLLYLPCPNDHEPFVAYLADRIIKRTSEPGEDWEAIRSGTEWLVEKERPASKGEPGPLNFRGPALAVLATFLWIAVGLMLTWRGLGLLAEVAEPWKKTMICSLAGALGIYKGLRVMCRVADRNLIRLRRIPQPSPVWKVFSGPMWLLITFFSTLGVAIRASGMNPAIRSTVLLAVGLAMLLGVVRYAMKLGLAKPLTERQTQRMPAAFKRKLEQS